MPTCSTGKMLIQSKVSGNFGCSSILPSINKMAVVFLSKINSNFFFLYSLFKIIFQLKVSAHDQLTDLFSI